MALAVFRGGLLVPERRRFLRDVVPDLVAVVACLDALGESVGRERDDEEGVKGRCVVLGCKYWLYVTVLIIIFCCPYPYSRELEKMVGASS